jgi:hypothetical protein
MGVPKLGGLD